MGAGLASSGYELVDFSEEADVYVINSCSVTGSADRKCRKVIRRALNSSPDAFIAVTGCYAQLRPEEISAIPGVDLVLGAGEKFNLPAYLGDLTKRESGEIHSCDIESVNQFFPSFSTTERTRSFLKVQDGCDYTCSYCTIPMARGRSRSHTVPQTVATAIRLLDGGAKEIILSGVNIGDFGAGTEETLLDLLGALDRIGAERIRISSIEPNLLTDEIIHFVAGSDSFVPHFHVPLQSGSDAVLRRMRRRYSREMYRNRIEHVLEVMPNCSVGVDVIVGFPGEMDDDFSKTFDLLDKLDIAYLHVFNYSERSGTDAAGMANKVSPQVRGARSRRLHVLSSKKKRAFYESCLSQIHPVLFETREDGMLEGFTDNYIRVEARGDQNDVGKVRRVKLKSVSDGVVQGAIAA